MLGPVNFARNIMNIITREVVFVYHLLYFTPFPQKKGIQSEDRLGSGI